MQLLTVLSQTLLFYLTTSQVNFGLDGVYPCRCQFSDRHPDNCDSVTGVCPSNTCLDGSKYGHIGNCQIENIALNRTASHTSRVSDGAAVDGDEDTCSFLAFGPKCTRTALTTWMIDLGRESTVLAVWIKSSHSHTEHLSRLTIRVAPQDPDWSKATICTQVEDTTDPSWHRLLCSVPLWGRYVRIEKEACSVDHEQLTYWRLCEVLVIDDIYLAAKLSLVTSSGVELTVHEKFYNQKFLYTAIIRGWNEDGCPMLTESTEKPLDGSSLVLGNLHARWKYEMRIQPSLRGNYYASRTKILFITPSSKPKSPPDGLTASEVNETFALITWNDLACSQWIGKEKSFEVFIDAIDIHESVNYTQTALLLRQLKPATTYTVKISSRNEHGRSAWRRLSFTTTGPVHDPGYDPMPATVGGCSAAGLFVIALIGVSIYIYIKRRSRGPERHESTSRGSGAQGGVDDGRSYNNGNEPDVLYMNSDEVQSDSNNNQSNYSDLQTSTQQERAYTGLQGSNTNSIAADDTYEYPAVYERMTRITPRQLDPPTRNKKNKGKRK